MSNPNQKAYTAFLLNQPLPELIKEVAIEEPIAPTTKTKPQPPTK